MLCSGVMLDFLLLSDCVCVCTQCVCYEMVFVFLVCSGFISGIVPHFYSVSCLLVTELCKFIVMLCSQSCLGRFVCEV